VGRGTIGSGSAEADVRQLAEHDAANLDPLGGAEQNGAALAATHARMFFMRTDLDQAAAVLSEAFRGGRTRRCN
jgi:hypothetical protein